MAGNFAFSGVALTSGLAVTASKAGFVTAYRTVAAPAGASVVVVSDLVLVPQPAAGKPVVTRVEPKLDGLFLAGVRVVNDYTASVNWNGSTPGNVRFYANDSLVATQTGTGPEYTATLDIKARFPPALRPGANRVRVVATSAAGIASQPADYGVYVLPLPFGLASAAALTDSGLCGLRDESWPRREPRLALTRDHRGGFGCPFPNSGSRVDDLESGCDLVQ